MRILHRVIIGVMLVCLTSTGLAGVSEVELAGRRSRLAALVDSSGAVLLRAAEPKQRSGDVNYRYRQESNFLYLTGIDEPNATLMVIPRGVVVDAKNSPVLLFVPAALADRLRADRAVEEATIVDVSHFPEIFARVAPTLKTLFVSAPDLRFVNDWMNSKPLFLDRDARRELEVRFPGLKVKNAAPLVTRLREIKSGAEIDLIRKAILCTGEGLRKAMRVCAPGAHEYELQGAVEYEMTRQGAGYPGFPSIIGSGPNSLVLHWDRNNREMHPGELVVLDVGAEFEGYAADITRTIPVSGTFSREQKEVYDAVLSAQAAVIAAIRPGLRWAELDRTARQELAPRGFAQYLSHSVSHHLGLDVHDPGSMDSLRSGMVITVEPGAYIPPTDTVLAPGYRGIGIRIEDDVLVTDKGAVLLSSGIPKTSFEIEGLMKTD